MSTPPYKNWPKCLVNLIYRTYQLYVVQNVYSWLLMLPPKRILNNSCTFATHRLPPLYQPPETSLRLRLLLSKDPNLSVTNTLSTLLSYATGFLKSISWNQHPIPSEYIPLSSKPISQTLAAAPYLEHINRFPQLPCPQAPNILSVWLLLQLHQSWCEAGCRNSMHNHTGGSCLLIRRTYVPITYKVPPTLFNRFHSFIIVSQLCIIFLLHEW